MRANKISRIIIITRYDIDIDVTLTGAIALFTAFVELKSGVVKIRR